MRRSSSSSREMLGGGGCVTSVDSVRVKRGAMARSKLGGGRFCSIGAVLMQVCGPLCGWVVGWLSDLGGVRRWSICEGVGGCAFGGWVVGLGGHLRRGTPCGCRCGGGRRSSGRPSCVESGGSPPPGGGRGRKGR